MCVDFGRQLGDSRIFERRVIVEDATERLTAENRRQPSLLRIRWVATIKTTIYNLEVLNKLGMCCFRGDKKAKEIRNKFNDVFDKHAFQLPTVDVIAPQN